MNLKNFFDSILNEEIYGNTATVYHRFSGKYDKVKSIIDRMYSNKNHIDFTSHDKGFYSTFNMNSQLNVNKKQGNNMKKTYGDCIMKCAVKGLHNFFFFDFDQYKKINPNAKKETFIKEQINKFNLNKVFPGNVLPRNHVDFSQTLENKKVLGNVKGVIYNGRYDGDCLLAYDYTSILPIAISNDEGKTWQKIDKNNLDKIKKDYYNINNQIEKKEAYDRKVIIRPTYIHIQGDNISSLKILDKEEKIDFQKKLLIQDTNLKNFIGCPSQIKWIDCNHSKLISLDGLPKELEYINISENKTLKTLKGFPNGEFNNLHFLAIFCSLESLIGLKNSVFEDTCDLNLSYNHLESIDGLKFKNGICGRLDLKNNHIKHTNSLPEKLTGILDISNNLITKKELQEYVKKVKFLTDSAALITDIGRFNAGSFTEEVDYFPYCFGPTVLAMTGG